MAIKPMKCLHREYVQFAITSLLSADSQNRFDASTVCEGSRLHSCYDPAIKCCGEAFRLKNGNSI
jgi:hypothetical protein